MAGGQLLKEYMGILVVLSIILLAIIVGIFTPQVSMEMPSLWLFGALIGLTLTFIIPYVASVRFHSPNIFDGDGNCFSFNEDQLGVVKLFGTDMAIITSGGFDNPKKLLAHENVSAGRTTLLILPARLVESIGNRRFKILRAPIHKLGFYEAREFLKNPLVQDLMERWEVRHAEVHMAHWTYPNLLPPTFFKRRVDFERIASYLSSVMTELGLRKETVEESWSRTMRGIRELRPHAPTLPPAQQPQQSEPKEEK